MDFSASASMPDMRLSGAGLLAITVGCACSPPVPAGPPAVAPVACLPAAAAPTSSASSTEDVPVPHEDEREDNPEQAMEPSHLAPFAALREVDCQAVAAAVRHRPAVLRGRTARGGRFELGYPVSSGPGSDAINEGLREYLASIRREADRELWENEGLEVECDVVAPRPVSRFVSLVCETHWLGAGRPSVNVHAFTFERCASTARLLDLQDLCRADVNCDEASLAWANQYQDPRLKIGFTSAPERPRDTGGRAWYTDVPRLGELALGPDGVTVYLQNRLAHVNYSLGTVHVPIAALRDSFAPDVLREWN